MNNETIFTDGDGGTIQIMEWIRDNGCPHLSYHIFKRQPNSRDYIMVSSIEEPEGLLMLMEIDESVTWFDYNGLKRYGSPSEGWTFCIEGHYYYASC